MTSKSTKLRCYRCGDVQQVERKRLAKWEANSAGALCPPCVFKDSLETEGAA